MMEEEEIKPKRLDRPVLDSISIADIEDYIAELRAEIRRAEAAIAQKRDARGHADGFFKM